MIQLSHPSLLALGQISKHIRRLTPSTFTNVFSSVRQDDKVVSTNGDQRKMAPILRKGPSKKMRWFYLSKVKKDIRRKIKKLTHCAHVLLREGNILTDWPIEKGSCRISQDLHTDLDLQHPGRPVFGVVVPLSTDHSLIVSV